MNKCARPRTVLLVEDDAPIREMLALCLEEEGYAVEQMADGQAAIAALDGRQPPPEHYCLVLLDMMLPKANGIEVLHHLAALGAYVPVLAMSAHQSALVSAEAAGARETPAVAGGTRSAVVLGDAVWRQWRAGRPSDGYRDSLGGRRHGARGGAPAHRFRPGL